MRNNLLTSKLTPPAISRYSVSRTSICDQVFRSSDARVVLVRAPAGFGKTTVMAQIMERYRLEGTAVAWLNLDDADNDLPRFLTYLNVALGAHLKDVADTEGEPGTGPRKAGQNTVLLADRLKEPNNPFVLFLDEVEVIRDPAVLAFIKQLISRLPTNTRFVLGSRCLPDIGLGRLRVHAQLLEVVPEQLRFSAEEAGFFLTQRRGLPLKLEQIQSLLRSTEGWPTALWLASLALERRTDAEAFIAGFAGSDTALGDYLAEDVLAGQPPEIREFLLKTSVFSQFNAALCDAVLERSDSAEMLAQLERDNLFLTLVDERQRIFRYHSLFRDFLRSQLTRHYRDAKPQLHRAAADWYLTENRPIPAIDHALETGDLPFTLSLLELHAELLLSQNRLRLLTRWFDALPAAALDGSPRLNLVNIWAVNLTRGPHEALVLTERIDPSKLGKGAALAQFHAMEPTLLGMRDRIDESYALGLARLQEVKPEHGFPYAMLSQTLANDSMILGKYAEARRYADQARAAQTGSASTLQMSLAGAVHGAIDLIQGRLQQALAELRNAAGITEQDLLQNGTRHLLPGVLLTEALYETGRLDRAESLLNLFLPLAQNLALPDQLIISHSVIGRIAERQNDPSRTLEVLTQLESLGHRLGLDRVIASARVEKSWAALMRGDVPGATEQLQSASEIGDWECISQRSYIANDKITLSIGQVRLMLRTGQVSAALSLLKRSLEIAKAAQRNRRALKLRILLAEALELDGQHKLAMRQLSWALEFGTHEGFVSSFLEEGPRSEALLRELLRTRQTEGAVSEDDALVTHLNNLAGSQQTTIEPETSTGPSVDALTRKEMQILKLLAQGHSNDSMAAKLFVSESTVRTHLRSINTKLQASNRIHALAIARQMHLIS